MAEHQTYYEYLLSKQESGELKTLLALGLPSYYLFFLEIYTYHLNNPKASHWDMAMEFNTSKKTIYRALHTLSQTI